MRVFYVFNIKKYFAYTYKDKPYKLFKILDYIYNNYDYDIELGYRYINQIINNFSKEKINKYLTDNLYNHNNYYKKANIHIICDNFEYTKLIVENNVIRIKTNQNKPTILKYLQKQEENIFVCDFSNKQYFWLKKDCQTDKNLIK